MQTAIVTDVLKSVGIYDDLVRGIDENKVVAMFLDDFGGLCQEVISQKEKASEGGEPEGFSKNTVRLV